MLATSQPLSSQPVETNEGNSEAHSTIQDIGLAMELNSQLLVSEFRRRQDIQFYANSVGEKDSTIQTLTNEIQEMVSRIRNLQSQIDSLLDANRRKDVILHENESLIGTYRSKIMSLESQVRSNDDNYKSQLVTGTVTLT
jgi:peptidoglycan hydrolase CwlO-like protein